MAELEKVVFHLTLRAGKGVHCAFFPGVLRPEMKDLLVLSFPGWRQPDKDGLPCSLLRQVLHPVFLDRLCDLPPVVSADKPAAFQAADFFDGTEPDTPHAPWLAGLGRGHADKVIVELLGVLLDTQGFQIGDIVRRSRAPCQLFSAAQGELELFLPGDGQLDALQLLPIIDTFPLRIGQRAVFLQKCFQVAADLVAVKRGILPHFVGKQRFQHGLC